jgi:hypothetical protein
MRNSRRSNFILLFILGLALSGCSTSSSYRVLFQNDSVVELSTSPERILLECEDLYDANIKGMYGFMMHVLDLENGVTTVAQGNTLDQDSCERRLRGIGKILGEGKTIYLAAIGNLNSKALERNKEYNFPGKGIFISNGKSLVFVAIANDRGLCYDAYNGFAESPCPAEPFPFWNRTGK